MKRLAKFFRMDRTQRNKAIGCAVLILLALVIVGKFGARPSFSKAKDWSYCELEKIDKTRDEFSFVVFGDNRDSGNNFNKLIRKLNREEALFAVSLGDLVHEGTKEEYDRFTDQIEILNRPLLTTVGNHEVRKDGRANYYELFGRFYYSFAVGDSYFIILDDSNGTNLDPRQMDWLRSELQESRKYKYHFVCMHVPLYDPREVVYKSGHSLKDLQFANRLKQLFDESNVTMLFVSHIHGFYKGTWGRTPYIITGGAGTKLDGNDPGHYFHHYVKVSVSDQGVKYRVVRAETPSTTLLNNWIDEAWMHVYEFLSGYFSSLFG